MSQNFEPTEAGAATQPPPQPPADAALARAGEGQALLSMTEAKVRELRAGAERLPKHVAQRHGAVVLRAEGDDTFTVGLLDPNNVAAKQEVARHLRTNSRRLLTEQVSPSEFSSLITVAYGAERQEGPSGVTTWKVINASALGGGADDDLEFEEMEGVADRDMDMRDQARMIMRDAYRYGASDIHFRPGRETGMVLFRKDGLLEPRISDIPKAEMRALATTLLSMGRVPPHRAAREPMDSKIRIRVADPASGEKKVAEYRAGYLPDINGVKVTLRLNVDVRDNLDELGFEEEQYRLIEDALRIPEGMILVTGPTGAGKSNTLQAMLKILAASGHREIAELADPIEFNVDGRTKINITEHCNWVKGIKHMLRNDPDVVSLSELRGVEETMAAFNAALTGHLVPTTLHATNVADCLTRLLKYGIEPHLLSRGLVLIMTQRLVRKLCSCKVEDREIEIDDSGRRHMVYKAVGCDKCNFRGYNGRTAFGEMMKVTPRLRDAITAENPRLTAEEIVQIAVREEGMLPMQYAAGRKLAAGVTSFLEVERVMRLEAAGESSAEDSQHQYRGEHAYETEAA